MKLRKLLFIVLITIIAKKYLFADDLVRKSYESKLHKVQITAKTEEPALSQLLNMVEVAVYDKDDGDFWYMWYIIDGNQAYLKEEFDTNPDLNISYSIYAGIKDVDIDQFACRIENEIADMKYSMNKDYYTEIPHKNRGNSYFAYSRTAKDEMKFRNKMLK